MAEEVRIQKRQEKRALKGMGQNRGFRLVFLFLAVFAPFEMMLAVFARNIIYPFGDQSFLYMDLLHQYMPFFQEFVEKVRAGEGLAYSWNVGMGSNFYALYGYYLASPLHWLAFLFPAERLVEFVSYLTIVKIGLAGLSAFLWFDSKRGKEGSGFVSFSALLFSSFYAMSGYLAAYNFNIMWLDCVVLAPIILLGLERLVKEGKMGLYVLALAFSIFSNFYLSIMICLFLVFYFGYLFLTEPGKLRALWKFAAGSLLAGGIAAFILIPEAFALLDTDFASASSPRKVETYFSVLEVLARHCMGIATEVEDGHWPNVYCGTAVFLLLPLYALNKGIPLKRRFFHLALAGFFLASFQLNALEYVWHGLNFPDCLPARQSFLYILILLTMCHDCLVNADKLSPGNVIKAYLATAVFFLFVEKYLKSESFHAWDWLMNLAFVTAYAICLYYYLRRMDHKNHDLLAVLVYVLVLAECTINMSLTSVATTDRVQYDPHAQDYQALFRRNAPEGDFQRFEMQGRHTRNDSAIYGFPSATVFSSTMNSYVKDFYAKFGMRYSKVQYDFGGATELVAALLNVSRTYSPKGNWENESWKLTDQENGIFLYEATWQLPFGYVAPKGFDLPSGEAENGLELQNELVRELGIEGLLFEKMEPDNSWSCDFTAREDGIHYGVLQNSEIFVLKTDVSNGWDQKEDFMKEGYVLPLGPMTAGDEAFFENGESEVALKATDVAVYRMDETVLESVLEKLGRRHMTQVKVGNAKVSGHLELDEPGRLITTVPREKGWTIRVNGEKVKPAYFGNAFLAVDLDAGSYEIEMNYVPAGRGLGILLSILSFGAFIGGSTFVGLRRRKISANAKQENDRRMKMEED